MTFSLTRHAKDRMLERHISKHDIENILQNGTIMETKSNQDKYCCELGCLGVIASNEWQPMIITAYRKETF